MLGGTSISKSKSTAPKSSGLNKPGSGKACKRTRSLSLCSMFSFLCLSSMAVLRALLPMGVSVILIRYSKSSVADSLNISRRLSRSSSGTFGVIFSITSKPNLIARWSHTAKRFLKIVGAGWADGICPKEGMLAKAVPDAASHVLVARMKALSRGECFMMGSARADGLHQ